MTVTFSQLFKDFKARKFQPVYLVYGEEPYYIDLITEYLEANVLTGPEKEFNQTIIYGRDSTTIQVISLCKAYPMMGNLQLVVLRESQDMDLRKAEAYKPMLTYMQNPSPHTLLLICYKYKKPPVEWLKAGNKASNVVLFESAKVRDYKINEWIAEHVREQGYSITTKGCSMIAEFLGTDLEKIVNELSKLFINHPREKPINEDIIEKYIGISKDYNLFELTDALARRDVTRTHRIAFHFADNPKDNPIFKIIPTLFSFYTRLMLYHSIPDKGRSNPEKILGVYSSQLNTYSIAARNYSPSQCIRVISLLRNYATRAVGIENSSTSNEELVKEMVFRIMN